MGDRVPYAARSPVLPFTSLPFTFLAAAHEMHQLEVVTGAHFGFIITIAIENLAIVFHHNQPRMQSKTVEQLGNGDPVFNITSVTVHGDVHRFPVSPFLQNSVVIHSSSSLANCSAACTGSAALHTARIMATPYAPAARTSGTRSAVMPPIARTGMRHVAAHSRSRFGPAGGTPGCVAV